MELHERKPFQKCDKSESLAKSCNRKILISYLIYNFEQSILQIKRLNNCRCGLHAAAPLKFESF